MPSPRLLPRFVAQRRRSTRRARLWLAGYLVFAALLVVPPSIEPWVLDRVVELVVDVSGPAAPVTHRAVEPLLNVALFVPLAALLCASLPGLRRVEVWVLCVLGSAAVELTQHLFLPGRVGSLRDVVTNSTGAAFGVLLHWAITRRAERGRAGRRRRGQSVRQQ